MPGSTWSPTFEPWKVAVTVARTASPSTSPVDASTPDGTSQATTRAGCAFSAAIARGHRIARLTLEAGAEQGVHHHSGPREPVRGERLRRGAREALQVHGRVPAQLGRRRHGEDDHRMAVLAQQAGCHEPVATVVALPHHHADRTLAAAAAAAERARPAPARSIRSSEGVPASWIAQASTARISSAS